MILTAILAFALQTGPVFDENTSISELTSLAESEIVEAQAELSMRLYFQLMEQGNGPDSAILAEETLYWAEQAAENGDASMLNQLGILAQSGVAQPVDYVRAESFYRRAIEAGDRPAIINMALMFSEDGNPENDVEAFGLLEPIYTNESPAEPAVRRVAAAALGALLTYGLGEVEQDYDRAFALLSFADQGEEAGPQTLFLIGRYHETGVGGAEGGEATALRYFERAAQSGHGRAAWKAGMQHLNGWGTEVDQAAAFYWIRHAAELNDERGIISTAVMYALGQGVAIDYAQSRYWYDQAASFGNAHAIRAIGMMDVVGQGGPVNLPLGTALLEMAREAGDQNAMTLLEQFEIPDDASFRLSVRESRANWLAERNLTEDDIYGGQQ